MDEGAVIDRFDHVTGDDGAVFVGECRRYPPALCGPLAERQLTAPLYRGSRFIDYSVSVSWGASVWPVVDQGEVGADELGPFRVVLLQPVRRNQPDRVVGRVRPDGGDEPRPVRVVVHAHWPSAPFGRRTSPTRPTITTRPACTWPAPA
jgi:hypothetical protein